MATRGGKQLALQHLHRLRGGVMGGGYSTVAGVGTVEAEPMESKPGERKKVLVLGGSGYVGTHICKEAVGRGIPVGSVSRSGRPRAGEPWCDDVDWVTGDLLQPGRWRTALDDVSAVISCVGAFGSNEQMRRINGGANVEAIRAAAEAGVGRFVFISAHDFGLPGFVMRGYYEGKRAAEDELLRTFPYSGVILRPGFIHGVRQLGSVKLPLNAIGSPLELLLGNMKAVSQVPVVGKLLVPPVKVATVARVAVRAATDNSVPPGVMDVWAIRRLGGDQ